MVGIVLVYLILGCVMDSLAMILLTVPVFFPLVTGLDFGYTEEEIAIWFGILALIAVEIGLITPPIGLNVYVINSLDGKTRLGESFRGVVPFVLERARSPRDHSVAPRHLPLAAGPGLASLCVRYRFAVEWERRTRPRRCLE